MDLVDKLRELAARVPKQSDLIRTEEGTKNALIMPFINALGYDVFNPLEVTPELDADIGTKKGEKVDYAIILNGEPVMLFECKAYGADLNRVHASQLYRYFSVTNARFGILTNGTSYRFFSDLNEPNKMDEVPFFVFDLLNFTDIHVETLKKFTKSAFDEEHNLSYASRLKYRSALKDYVDQLLTDPSEDFVRFCVKESKAYSGIVTQNVIEEFTPLLKDVFRTVINENVEKRLKNALATSEQIEHQAEVESEQQADNDEPEITTTQEEVDGFLIVKAIIREVVDVERIAMRDVMSYCSVLIDDSNRKAVCRLHFNRSQKYIGIVGEDKNEIRHEISSLNDIYDYADELKQAALSYVNDD